MMVVEEKEREFVYWYRSVAVVTPTQKEIIMTNELTVSKIISDLDNLPPMEDLTGALRDIVVMEGRVDAMLKPIVTKRGEQHTNLMVRVFETLAPIYDQREHLGEDLPHLALKVYRDALSASIIKLGGDGIVISLNTNGKIKEPKTLGQYDTDIQRVLELDTEGVFLDVLSDGSYKYQSVDSIRKLGKALADAQKQAKEKAAMDRFLANGGAILAGQAKQQEEQKQKQEEPAKSGEQPAPAAAEAAAEPNTQATEPTVIDMAVAELIDVINTAREFAKAEVSTGGTVEDWIISQLAGLEKKVNNLLAHNLRSKAGAALDKAASKAA